MKLKRKLLIIVIINILVLQNLANSRKFCCKIGTCKFSNKENSNKTKHLLVENLFKKLKTFDLIYFRSKSHFEHDDT